MITRQFNRKNDECLELGDIAFFKKCGIVTSIYNNDDEKNCIVEIQYTTSLGYCIYQKIKSCGVYYSTRHYSEITINK